MTLVASCGVAAAESSLAPAEVRQIIMDEILIMTPRELAVTREGCVHHLVGETKAKGEAKYGPGSFPEIDEYCLAVLKETVADDEVGGLYINLAIQQLGIGRELTFESDLEKVGDKHIQIMFNVRAAAEAERTTYRDATGTKDIELTCPMALDAGVTFAAANPEQVSRDFTDEQVGRMARACYNPEISEVTISTTGETMTVQRMGLIAGELLGRGFVPGPAGTAAN